MRTPTRRSIAPRDAPNGIAAITPERVIREGVAIEQILEVIDEDADIVMLVLAANPGAEGPGPLVTAMAGTSSCNPTDAR